MCGECGWCVCVGLSEGVCVWECGLRWVWWWCVCVECGVCECVCMWGVVGLSGVVCVCESGMC